MTAPRACANLLASGGSAAKTACKPSRAAPANGNRNPAVGTDHIDKKGSDTYMDKLCEVGTATSSNEATVTS